MQDAGASWSIGISKSTVEEWEQEVCAEHITSFYMMVIDS
jgi:DNA-binding transcriptional regulator YiaG